MDFIERLTGFSPDGGDGSTEMLYFIGIVGVALVLVWPFARTLFFRSRRH